MPQRWFWEKSCAVSAGEAESPGREAWKLRLWQNDLSRGSNVVSSPVMTPPLNWGILGTGKIAHHFTSEPPDSSIGRLVAVGSRAAAPGGRFAGEA
jgi:hypothetical protein